MLEPWIVPAEGFYYLMVVAGNDAPGEMTYDLQVRTSEITLINKGQAVMGTLDQETSKHRYALQGTAGESVTAMLRAIEGHCTPSFVIYNRERSGLVTGTNYWATELSAVLTFPDDDYYVFEVTFYSFSDECRFELLVQAASE